MIARKRGGILNVSSSAGFVPIPGFAVYAATKAYVNSFSEALRAEVAGNGISVCSLCPGPVHTEFTEVAQRPGEPPQPGGPEFVYVSASDVAAAGLGAIENDHPLVIPGGGDEGRHVHHQAHAAMGQPAAGKSHRPSPRYRVGLKTLSQSLTLPLPETQRDSAERWEIPLRADHLYFTEQPYGLVSAVVTALPASASSSACFT